MEEAGVKEDAPISVKEDVHVSVEEYDAHAGVKEEDGVEEDGVE